LVWEHNGTSIVFENWNAFLWQEPLCLPVTWPGDKVYLGSEEEMKDKMAELTDLPIEQITKLKARMKPIEGGGIERTISIIGGRYDREVHLVFNSNEGYWKTNPRNNEWLDASKLKEVMDTNSELKASEALSQF
jgi:hypothetical protein